MKLPTKYHYDKISETCNISARSSVIDAKFHGPTFKTTAPPVEWPKRKHGMPGFSDLIFSKNIPCIIKIRNTLDQQDVNYRTLIWKGNYNQCSPGNTMTSTLYSKGASKISADMPTMAGPLFGIPPP